MDGRLSIEELKTLNEATATEDSEMLSDQMLQVGTYN
eukprot:COSAG05_NODE_223_length_13640_cov_1551.628979_5_plen_37_part_00